MPSLSKLIYFLSPHERYRALLIFAMMIFTALLDMIGVASIMPFMAVLAKPQIIQESPWLARLFQELEFGSSLNFLLFLGFCVFFLLVMSLLFKALTTYYMLRFALRQEYILGRKLMEGYLRQPYAWFLNKNSADLGANILSEVGKVVYGGILPVMALVSQSAVALALIAMLLVFDPWLAVTIGAVLGAAYCFVFKATSSFLSRISVERLGANHDRFIAINEAFGAFKEIKVGGLEKSYVDRFSGPAKLIARYESIAQAASQMPRFVLEGVAFGGLLLVMLYLMARNGNFESALPIITLYAFAGYRLMPALQQIYSSSSQMLFAASSTDALYVDLMGLSVPGEVAAHFSIHLKNEISLNNIYFTYPNAPRPALRNVSLSIPAYKTIGLVGATGSGKSTTVDLILGLLEPQQGTLSVDGRLITGENRSQWQRTIGYVPQQIYLSDESVASNIAFGLETPFIDFEAIERAAKIANLHEFVVNELPQGYSTFVGERGVRLSGGQRQRIGIARALYHNPQILILDEATSALDNLTEKEVMEAVNNLGHQITIILIAHRLNTVRLCEKIYVLENGGIKHYGSYDELKETCDLFINNG